MPTALFRLSLPSHAASIPVIFRTDRKDFRFELANALIDFGRLYGGSGAGDHLLEIARESKKDITWLPSSASGGAGALAQPIRWESVTDIHDTLVKALGRFSAQAVALPGVPVSTGKPS